MRCVLLLPRAARVALGLARRRERHEGRRGPVGRVARPGGRPFGEGVVVQLANPKAAIFMVAFYPQFVPADRPLFATSGGPGSRAGRARDRVLPLARVRRRARGPRGFRSSRVRRRLDAIAGTVLVALGVRVALSSR